MNTAFDEIVALDTNEYIHAIRAGDLYPACRRLIFESLHLLQLHFPFQVQTELRRNLTDEEMAIALRALKAAQRIIWSYDVPPVKRIRFWESQGAKKGDAVICAALEAANVKFLISENRHFLAQIESLPFQVLSAEQFLDLLLA